MRKFNMKAEVLSLLKGTDDYISGQMLCDRFNVSRTAIWKAVNQLKEEGYQIEAVQKRGYHLVAFEEKYTKSEIESRRVDAKIGHFIKYFDEVDSTNAMAKKYAEDGATEGTVIVADVQNNGKGRRGRTWKSPKESGIWMSVILKPDIATYRASMLTLTAGLAVSKAIEKITGLENQIKWPNDIVANGRKICGILTEMNAEIDRINYIIVGIGINVNMKEFPIEIREKATSIFLETGKEQNRLYLLDEVLNQFEKYYDIFLKTKDLSSLMEEYNSRLINKDHKVKILQDENSYEAISKGINENGELIVEDENGNQKEIVSGDVSVRGVYGYV